MRMTHLVVTPRQAVVREGIQSAEVCRDSHNSVEVQRDGEPADQNGQHRHDVEDDHGETGRQVRDACGGVSQSIEEIQAIVE